MPELEPSPNSGLFVIGHAAPAPVPLAGVSVAAEVRSLCARVTVTQRYVNREAVPIEAVYVFPLDEGAAVCGFEALIDGTLVVGEVKEREHAFRMYDDAMADGHGAYLLDEERPDIFQASVGNLPPGSEAVLKITYVTELGVDGGDLRFVVPTTVSPRYAPREDQVAVGRADAETLNPPRDLTVPYGLELSVRVTTPGRVARVVSPSHPVDLAIDDAGVTVTLAQADAALDRDVVLSLEGTGFDVPRAWVERTDEGTHALAVGFVPQFGTDVVPAEVVFVVDRSGSMAGSSIAEVRNALQICLRSLVPGCLFNIVGFGSTFTPLFGSSRPYDQASLDQASAHVARLEGDMAGTEVLPALTFVLTSPRVSELPRQVVVLTDGQVSNTDEVLRLIKTHAGAARVFAFGIGAGASHHLVQGMARAGGGTAEFIAPRERIEPRVTRLMRRLLTPSLTDLRIDWGGLSVTQVPSVIPALFAGARLVQYAFAGDVRPVTIRLTARSTTGPVTFEIPLDPSTAAPGSTVATLAARARIRELEESPVWLSARASQQRRSRPASGASEIVELGVRYGLVSRETSFVAIERRETPVLGDVQLRRVPIALTREWGGSDEKTGALSLSATPSGMGALDDDTGQFWIGADGAIGTPPASKARSGVVRSLLRGIGFSERGRATRSAGRSSAPPDGGTWSGRGMPPGSPRSTSRQPDAPARSGMLRLVELQHADGSWALDDALASAVGSSLGDLQRGLDDLRRASGSAPGGGDERIWATAIALAWLDQHAPALAGEWEALAAKAARWLEAAALEPQRAREWREAARAWSRSKAALQ